VDFESLISKRLRLTMSAEGCATISVKKVSGARPDRRELLKLLKALTPGDVVTVTRIDQLARSTL
jgi:DNA invertase Pin-like site-specific DNA recombinase